MSGLEVSNGPEEGLRVDELPTGITVVLEVPNQTGMHVKGSLSNEIVLPRGEGGLKGLRGGTRKAGGMGGTIQVTAFWGRE